MKLQNAQICSNCSEENALFEKNCVKCKHYLRTTIVNIDLWKTIWQLLESPTIAIKNIIWAEHKNFISFLFLLLGAKLYITAITFQSALKQSFVQIQNSNFNIAIHLGIYIITILVFTKFLSIVIIKNKVRFKDNLAIILYSGIPLILSLFVLAPVEYGIFGKHWFVYNPSPFMIKETLAYILTGLEMIMVLWGIIILFIGIKLQSNSLVLSIIMTLLFWVILIIEVVYIPYILL